jgi:transcriptional regulator with XRE-family HTH domain
VAHVRHATLSQLERGIRADVTTETAKRIARALGVSVDYLIGMYEDDEDPDPATVALVGWGSLLAPRCWLAPRTPPAVRVLRYEYAVYHTCLTAPLSAACEARVAGACTMTGQFAASP